MYKFFHSVKKDKRGFTIAELMVTIALMSIITVLLSQFMGSIWKKYRMVENLYIIQTEVQAIADAFQADSEKGSLSTATNMDLFYENPSTLESSKSFASCPELGTFTEAEDGKLLFNSRSDFTYSYLFVYKGYFYVLDYDAKYAYRFKFTDEAKVNIDYEVSIDAFKKDTNNKESATSEVLKGHRYLPAGVTVTVSSAPIYDFYYELHTSFSLKNAITNRNEINMNNPNFDALTNEYVAGYTKGTNGILPASYNGGTGVGHYPNIGYPEEDNYMAETGKSYPNLSKAANVIRYISTYKFNSSVPMGGDGGMTLGTSCGVSLLMMDNKLGEGVKTTLRGFRDNVLKGNAVGEMVIDKYYNSWSPAIIKASSNSPVAKKVLTDAVVSAAYLIEIAN